MLRFDDLAVRTAELNRATTAVDRSGWMTTGPNRVGRPRRFGATCHALIARVTRRGSPATSAAPSPLRSA